MMASSWLGQRWSGLEASEQRLLKIAAPLVILMLLYLAVWQPVQAWRETNAINQQQQAQDLQRLAALKTRLVTVVFLDERQWLALAASAGLRDVELSQVVDLEQKVDVWRITAKAANPAMVEKFLNTAAAKGWHWQTLNMQGKPLQLTLVLRPL